MRFKKVFAIQLFSLITLVSMCYNYKVVHLSYQYA